MQIDILFFGQLTDITGCSKMQISHPASISQLKDLLAVQFPALKEAKYSIALNNQLVLEDQIISENSTIAFMPPFSGG